MAFGFTRDVPADCLIYAPHPLSFDDMKTYGIDANALTQQRKTGTERYAWELIREMMKEPLLDRERVVLYASGDIPDLGTLPNGWQLKILTWKLKKAWTHLRLSWELTSRPPNVFFSPAHEIPLFCRQTGIVATVHDVAFRIVPDVYPDRNRMRQEWAVGRAIRKASRLIAISETTKNDLVNLYKIPPGKIIVTPLAVRREEFAVSESDRRRVLDKYRLAKGQYFLTVGRIENKKNIPFFLSAFEMFKQTRNIGDPYQLVLAGSFGHGAEEIKSQIENLNCRNSVRVLGYVPDEDLAGLFCGASAYVFPSQYEGFGIPALEAMAANIPLIASDIPALREVAGDAALFAHPGTTQAWSDAMRKIVDDRESAGADLIQRGSERLLEYSWEKTARRTWEVLRSI